MKLNFKIALIVIFLISILLMSFNFQISYSQILDIENIQTSILKKIGAKKVKNGINKEKSGDPFYTLKR